MNVTVTYRFPAYDHNDRFLGYTTESTIVNIDDNGKELGTTIVALLAGCAKIISVK